MHYAHIWNRVISPDERVRFEFTVGNRYIFTHLTLWALVGLATIWFYGVGVVIFLIALFYYGYFIRVSNAYAFTTKRVLIHHGWLSTSIVSLDYSKITEIRVRQSFVSRLFYGTGSLSVDTAGTDSDEIRIPLIQDPYGVKRTLSELMDESLRAQRQAGIYQRQGPF